MSPALATVTSIYHHQTVNNNLSPMWLTPITDWTVWLQAAGRPKTTITTRTYHLRRLANDHPGRSPWNLTTADLIAWTGAQTWATETRRSYRSTLITFFRWAISAGHTDHNPADGLPRVKPAQPRPRPTPDTVYLTALRGASPRVHLILRFAAEMGLRRAEIAQIHRRDLLTSTRGYSLLVHGKGQKDRVIPLTPGLAAALRECDTWLFPGLDNGHLSPRYIGKLATKALPGDWTIHSLRHRFASRAYAIDRDLLTVQDLLGHASPVTTRTYVLPPDDAARRLVMAAAA